MCTITLSLAKRGEAIPGPYSSLTCFAGVRPGAVPERGEIGGHRHRRARWSIHSGQRRLHAHEPRSCSRLNGEARDRLWRGGSRPPISVNSHPSPVSVRAKAPGPLTTSVSACLAAAASGIFYTFLFFATPHFLTQSCAWYAPVRPTEN